MFCTTLKPNLPLVADRIWDAQQSSCYDAHSYAWGDVSRKNQVSIICNGHSIRIRRNLFLALHQIWAHWPWKGIWADAICINQDDVSDKSSQISMMSVTYSNARSVFVWLGEATDVAMQVLRCIKGFSSHNLRNEVVCRERNDGLVEISSTLASVLSASPSQETVEFNTYGHRSHLRSTFGAADRLMFLGGLCLGLLGACSANARTAAAKS